MSIEITHETETRLAGEARRLGISVELLLNRLIDEHLALAPAARRRQGLPVWHLGTAGPLHRRNLYDDVR